MTDTIFTIGHSSHDIAALIALLETHRVSIVGDVRSHPYSRFHPQFNRENLKYELENRNIKYCFWGNELGARSSDPTCYVGGRIKYDLLAETVLFRKGVEQICNQATNARIALMCAEKDPIQCHRTILIARRLEEIGFDVQHIRSSGRLESQSEAIKRLTIELGIHEGHLFQSCDDVIATAYAMQADRIAYQLMDDPRASKIAGRV